MTKPVYLQRMEYTIKEGTFLVATDGLMNHYPGKREVLCLIEYKDKRRAINFANSMIRDGWSDPDYIKKSTEHNESLFTE